MIETYKHRIESLIEQRTKISCEKLSLVALTNFEAAAKLQADEKEILSKIKEIILSGITDEERNLFIFLNDNNFIKHYYDSLLAFYMSKNNI